MNLRSLATRAKQLFGRRGGAEALKEEAQELRDTVDEKAKAAAEAVREAGTAYGGDQPAAEQRRTPEPAQRRRTT